MYMYFVIASNFGNPMWQFNGEKNPVRVPHLRRSKSLLQQADEKNGFKAPLMQHFILKVGQENGIWPPMLGSWEFRLFPHLRVFYKRHFSDSFQTVFWQIAESDGTHIKEEHPFPSSLPSIMCNCIIASPSARSIMCENPLVAHRARASYICVERTEQTPEQSVTTLVFDY